MEKVTIPDKEFIILTAPSGAGKTTLAHELLQRLPELAFSVSVTTRQPRPGEVAGKDYYFITVEEFKKKIQEKAFVEYELVYEGKYYGTLRSELERIWKDHKYPLRVVDVKGAERLKKMYGEKALSIFIKPPSMEVLEQRLRNRGSDDDDGVKERLTRALREMKFENSFDHVIHNKDLRAAVDEAVALVKAFIYHGQNNGIK